MAENNLVSILWLLFFLLFATLAFKSFKESKRELKHLQPTGSVQITAAGVDFKAFLQEFRDFYKETQLSSGIAFGLAALTSLVSLVLSLRS